MMENVLRLENISMEFGNRKIIDKFNYSFHKGIYIVKGRSGIGKTTLLNIIAGYIKPIEGRVVLKDGCKIGYSFQEDLIFENLTVEENMLIKYRIFDYAGSVNMEVISENLDKFGILSLQKSKVYMLSGGEKQRLKMAMLSLDNPDVILLDEPTSMLDDNNKISMIREIENNWEDKVVILVTHDDLLFSKEVTYIEFGGAK